MAEIIDNVDTNLELQKTLKIGENYYNVNAVYSDKAGKVTTPLVIKESLFTGLSEGSFNGDIVDSDKKEINYVPADQGGIFNNPIYLSNPTQEPIDSEIITSGQINNRITRLTGEPVHIWDTSVSPLDIPNNLYLLKNQDDQAHKFNIITGTESDFYLLQDAINGDFDSTSDKLTYTIINQASPILGWKTTGLDSSAEGTILVPTTYTGKYTTLAGSQSTTTQSIKEITESTFKNNTKITSVVIPDSVNIIGSRAFYNCTNLKNVIISKASSKTKAAVGASTVESWFEGCSTLKKVILGSEVTEIGKALFRNCSNLVSITVPEKVTTIYQEAFSGCKSLQTVVLPAGLVSIAVDAFEDCPSIKAIYFTGTEDQWNSIEGSASLSSITKIFNYVITEPILPDESGRIDLSTINDEPFIYICKDIESATIPASNKMFLKLPDSDDFVEISKGAARLESPKDATVSGYYTYETLAAIIAGINARLDGLGGEELKLPVTSAIIPKEDLHLEVLEDTFDSNAAASVPTVRQLEEAISKIQGEGNSVIADIINNNTDSLKALRDDLTDLEKEVAFDLGGAEAQLGKAIDYSNTRIDKLEKALNDIDADEGIILDGTTFKHINRLTFPDGLLKYVVSDGGFDRELAFGGPFSIPSITYDKNGHITNTSTTKLELPSLPTASKDVAGIVQVGTNINVIDGEISIDNYAGSDSAGGPANSVKAALMFSNAGDGDAVDLTYDGSVAKKISYNSIGAAPAECSPSYVKTSGNDTKDGDLQLTGNLNAYNTEATNNSIACGWFHTLNGLKIHKNNDTFHNNPNNPHIQLDKDGLIFDSSLNAKITAGTFNATSDARLKENFEILNTEKSILDLPTYKFDFINGAKNQIGCKAQDLQEICPEIVHEGEDGYLSIQESKIVYLLLDEIKKLRKEVDELKNK